MAEPHLRLSREEYLTRERRSEGKHEYLDGEVFAMTGASLQHNRIVWNLAGILYSQLRGRACQACIGDMRIQVTATGLYTYPDLVVVCGEPRFADRELDTLLNPTLIVEVLSPSTEAHDRGKKFAHYRTIESLAEVVLVSQERVEVERFSRQPDGGWLLLEANRIEERLALPSIGCELLLADVYERVFGETARGLEASPPPRDERV
ncbi:MAG TPA: Uma2 family endonuclease [Thermoanaerobaculia bacterium]|nr:Uma2 family endonuclease [Thermoanaerobaculia bacterium]